MTINSILSSSYTLDQYYTVYDGTWYSVLDEPGEERWWAYDLQSNGGYFLIKTGEIKLVDGQGKNVPPGALLDDNQVSNVFLYKNLDSTDYAVVSYTELLEALNEAVKVINSYYSVKEFGIDKISHLREVTSPVPVPSSALLLGSSLLGLVGLASRRRG